MYPGACAERSKGGSSSRMTWVARRTRCVRTESIARSANRDGTAPESTAHDWILDHLHQLSVAGQQGICGEQDEWLSEGLGNQQAIERVVVMVGKLSNP